MDDIGPLVGVGMGPVAPSSFAAGEQRVDAATSVMWGVTCRCLDEGNTTVPVGSCCASSTAPGERDDVGGIVES